MTLLAIAVVYGDSVITPAILAALDPRHAGAFLVWRRPALLMVIGAIVLTITGAAAACRHGALWPPADPDVWLGLVLHARNVITTALVRDVPWIGEDPRVQVEPLGKGFWRMGVQVGFMQTPDVPAALRLSGRHGLEVPLFEASHFLSRETVVAGPGGAMAPGRERLFAALSRNAGGVADYFRLPDSAVVELGTRVQI